MIRRVGPYELLALLGRGGMGAVYRGRHVVTGAVRAVKLLEGATNQAAGARFEREGRALARVRHPGVVTVHEVGVEGAARWLAMDLVEGETLEALAARGPLEPGRAARLIEDVARGVGALHAAGIVHRDLKPANVIVRPDSRPVVVDLGLALAPDSDERLTRTGGVAGTLAYLAPEQLRGEVSPRTDVHALGLILHELLAGAPVFGDDGPAVLAQLMSSGRPLPPRTTPRALADVLRLAHAADPARRPADGIALADELRRALESGLGPRAGSKAALASLAATATVVCVALAAFVSPGAVAPPEGAVAPAPSTTVARPPVVEDPTRALARATRLQGPERRAALDEWLARFPQDPRAAATRALADDLARQAPRWTATAPKLVAARFLDTRSVIVATQDGAVQVLDASTGHPLATMTAPISPQALAPLSPAEWLLLAPSGALLRLRLGADGAAGAEGFTTHDPLPSGRHLATAPRATHALASGLGPDAYLVPLAGGRNVRLDTADRKVSAIALSSDGALAAAGCGSTALEEGLRDYTLLVWDVASGVRRARLDVLSFPSALAFLSDGSFVVATSVGQMYHVMPDGEGFAITGTFVRPGGTGPTEEAHAYGLTCVASDPSGRLVATAAGGTDALGNEVAVWDVATRARRWLQDGYDGRPSAVDLAPDGSALLVVEPVSGKVECWAPLSALGRAP